MSKNHRKLDCLRTLLILGALVVTGACNSEPRATAPPAAEKATPPATSAPADSSSPSDQAIEAMLSDSQVLGVLRSANEGEIKAGKDAKDKAVGAEVKQFAEHMVSAHTAAQDKVKAANINPDGSELSKALEEQAAQEETLLKGLSGAAFDRAYLESQARMHQQVLTTLDQQLVPSARNAEVQQLLQTLRPDIEDHLRRAKELLNAQT